MRIDVRHESWPLSQPFRIARGEKHVADVVVAEIVRGGSRGRGESLPYGRYGESVDSVMAAVRAWAAGAPTLDREALRAQLPPGAARNAIDCALWDLEAQESRTPVWTLAGLPAPKVIETAYTLVLDDPAHVYEAALANADRPILKLKLGSPVLDGLRIQAARRGAPRSILLADVNEGWTSEDLKRLYPVLRSEGIVCLEQPMLSGSDRDLVAEFDGPVLCADESFHVSFADLSPGYRAVNIKLDKSGGLTQALHSIKEARSRGMGVMVGSMVATSLAIAPALLLAGLADWVDLDGPLFLRADRELGLVYEGSKIFPAPPGLWGSC